MSNQTDTPAPLSAAEIDLRDFPSMALNVSRLRDSELASAPDAEAFRIAVISWCVAWHQLPAGSLPSDDATLARMLGFGRDLRGWRKAREAGGLRGWVLCSDGRLYHPVVAETVVAAWESKTTWRARREKDAERLRKWREERDETGSETPSEARSETNIETRFTSQLREQEGKVRESKRLRDCTHAGDPIPDQDPPDPRRLAPPDLAEGLRAVWTEIATEHGAEIATRARDATKRLFGAVTESRMRETFAEAYQRDCLALPASNWPDFRRRIAADKAGLIGAPAGSIDPIRAAAIARKAREITHAVS